MTCNTIYGNIQGCATPITLPGTQGATGATGSSGVDGTALLLNSFTNTTSTADQSAKEYIGTTLLANTFSSPGDAIEIEGIFSIDAGVEGEFYIMFGVNGAPTTKVATYTVNSPLLASTTIKLKALISMTGASAQKVEGNYTLTGIDDSTGTIPITTSSEIETNVLDINLMAKKSINGGIADITSELLRIKKYAI